MTVLHSYRTETDTFISLERFTCSLNETVLKVQLLVHDLNHTRPAVTSWCCGAPWCEARVLHHLPSESQRRLDRQRLLDDCSWCRLQPDGAEHRLS